MKKALAALLLIPVLVLSACGGWKTPAAPGETERPTPAAEPTPTPAPTAHATPTAEVVPTVPPAEVPAPVWALNTWAIDYRAEDGALVFHASLSVPQIENAAGVAAYEAINAHYESAVVQYQVDVADRGLWAQDDYAVSAAAGFPFFPNSEDSDFKVSLQTDRLASICRSMTAAAGGGEEGQRFRMAETFDLSTGRQVAFADCFTDADAALEKVRASIRAQFAAAPQQGVTQAALDAAFAPEHFYLTDAGVVFWYQQGDLSGLSAPLEFTVSYNTLEGLLAEWINL